MYIKESREFLKGGTSCIIKHKFEYIKLSYAGETKNIAIRDIRYFEFINRRVVVYYDKNKSFTVWATLNKFEKQLETYGFLRIHSAYLVKTTFIESIKRGQIELKDGTSISFNKDYTLKFKRILEKQAC